jgi:Tol biopolymer transport system component
MDAGGATCHGLARVEGNAIECFSWSSDSRWLCFSSGARGKEALYVIHADGQNLRKLTEGGAVFPAWQPISK